MTIREIVVGVDGSEPSARAVQWSAGVARAIRAHVTAVHVIDPMQWPASAVAGRKIAPAGQQAWDRAIRKEFANAWCAPLREAGVDYSAICVQGYPPLGILEQARDATADLIVVGTRGHGGFADLLLGSVSRHLVHHAPMPVVVTRGHTATPPTHLLVGVDGSDEAGVALAWAADLATTLTAKVTIVQGLPPNPLLISEAELADIRRRLSVRADEITALGLDCAAEALPSAAPAGLLMEVASRQQADLIVVGHRGVSAISEWALGSVGSELTHHAQQPVVIVRTPPVPADHPLTGSARHYVSASE